MGSGLSSLLIPHVAELAGQERFCLTDLPQAWLAACASCSSLRCTANLPVPCPLPLHLSGERVGGPRGPEAGTTALCEANVAVIAQASEAFSVLFDKLLVRETIHVLWF